MLKMALALSSKDYVEYIGMIASKINSEGDYITSLDAATGDGDHWANLNAGFTKLVSISDELSSLPIADMLKKTGMTLMSAVGGSSGVLYGSAYLAAAKALAGKESLDLAGIADMLEAMLEAIMARGSALPGQKTMIDALHPAVQALKNAIGSKPDETQALEAMKDAALQGANDTKDMAAVRGRAVYQSGKGVGHLDPGAVTMAYQIEILAELAISKTA
jgi:phosphoenolpyruvate---glycerone phosphotransferase subunit DhaL